MSQGKPQRILVVEDDRDLSDLISLLLEGEGYACEAVGTGTDAVSRVQQTLPTAVILDVMLPEMNGFEVCRKLKFDRRTNLIPILMLTSLDSREKRSYGLQTGADRYLTKPFEPEVLLRELRAVLDRRKQLASMATRSVVEIQMSSESRHLEQLNDMLTELFLLTPLSDVEINRIRYAVIEMVENAVEWGNRRQPDLLVRMSYEVYDDHIRFVITDEGRGFNPTNIPHAAREDDPLTHLTIREKLGLRDGGFGILIAKGMVDSLEYNPAGNQVTLIKRFTAGAQSAKS